MSVKRYSLAVGLCALVAIAGARVASAQDGSTIPDIGPTGEIVKLHTSLQFTEGPAADSAGNLFFTDIPASRIYKSDAEGNLTVFREPSNSANGLMFNAAGELVACEMEGRVVAISADGKSIQPIAEQFQGKRFNAPNDLVVDANGGVYFTDPHFRSPMPLPQEKTCVYYVTAEGEVSRLVDDLPAPNGVILSPDEKTLYVIPSGQAEMMSYPVEGPGKIGAGKVFCTLKQKEGQQNGGGDGLTVDTKGNLYITSALGLQVYAADGKFLGVIEFPEQPANATFGGPDGKTLFVTARTSVYKAPMAATGHRFPAGKK